MAYSKDQRTEIVNEICLQVARGERTRVAIKKADISFDTFFRWIEDDEDKSKQYARACELRAESMADEILAIADSTKDDVITDDNGNPVTNHKVIQRDRLRVDTRKWLMSKMMPKKYGERQAIDHTTNGKEITPIALTKEQIKKLDQELENDY